MSNGRGIEIKDNEGAIVLKFYLDEEDTENVTTEVRVLTPRTRDEYISALLAFYFDELKAALKKFDSLPDQSEKAEA